MGQHADHLLQAIVALHARRDRFAGVEHGAVIPPAE
jgi:hypothetical protein